MGDGCFQNVHPADQVPVAYGRSGYNKDGEDEEDKCRNYGRSGYNKDGEDEEDKGRSGYN
ncbi:uncharacterized protein B0I36DRAFT_361543 [Microdochium trichocladiopsis]|uniref:Uncharacterized protein n=1 Tax=Microdochium trichocladiopsis TaxID=1682393 RepID=A0A9P9BRI6_9PEZI|nr:uncharacterized protein B0I36DRAFT_361543 [Microdochium trichocladiopsis]KAH7032773.1 hypothetical protein B0I36DRAFT_361543 [Microdochium trichocladiopsis]